MLAALRRAGDPYELSPGRLLRETLVTSGTMTNRVDRLAGRGFVERHPDPEDRRGVLVRLTAEGKDAVDGAFTALLDAERALLADLPASAQKDLAGLLRRLLAPFASSTAHSSVSAASIHSSSSDSFSARTVSSSAPRVASCA